jgi:electron transfer flavoprotein beta subunit
MVAEFLEWPHIALAISMDSDGSCVTIERPVEGGKVTLEACLPAVVTFGGSHAVWNPRYATLPGIMKARKKLLDTKKLAGLGIDGSLVGPGAAKIRIASIEMPPQRAVGRIIEGGLDTGGKAAELVRALHEEAKVI